MKAFISIDMEGICGVVREIETDPGKGGEAYQQSRLLMTLEGNAAIEGCLKAGVTEVLIADSHWNFDNLIPEELHEAATLLRGTPRGYAMVQDSTPPTMCRYSSGTTQRRARRERSSITPTAERSPRSE